MDQTKLIQKHPDLVAKVESGEMTLEKAASTAKLRKRNNDPKPGTGKARKPKGVNLADCRKAVNTFNRIFKEERATLEKQLKDIDTAMADKLTTELSEAAELCEKYAAELRGRIKTPIEDAS